jgi:glycerophosphoryl diester phosphodiesterase
MQRLVTAAVVGAVATGVGALTVTAPPLTRRASAMGNASWQQGTTADRRGLTGVDRLEAAPDSVRSGPSGSRKTAQLLSSGPATSPVPPGTDSSGTDPSGTDPSGTGPSGTGPSGTDPSGADRAGAGRAAPIGPLAPPAATLGRHRQPLIIGHRGASAYRAEETLDSYRLAIAQGADYIEADLVTTADGALVARHENELSATTDVAAHPEFADRRRTTTINGVTWTGWFTEDFTLAELRTLRAVSRGHHDQTATATVPTLAEIIELVRGQRRPIGLYLELKTPAYFASLGLPLEPGLADALTRARLDGPHARVYVESFDSASLRRVRQLADVPEIQLIGGADAADAAVQATGLTKIREYAVGIGIDRGRLADDGPTARALVERAHADRLEVHVFTFGSDPQIAYQGCFALGVDGVFTDNPDLAVTARRHAATAQTGPQAS